jgi:hypothetical protein
MHTPQLRSRGPPTDGCVNAYIMIQPIRLSTPPHPKNNNSEDGRYYIAENLEIFYIQLNVFL